MRYLLGIDFGGGASKATVLSEYGVICATNTTEYATYYPKPGYAEQNPDDWVKATCENITGVLKKSGISPDEICAVSLDAATHTAVIMDDDFNIIRPAQGGNITAKIKCITKPQMATVRTKTESSDIIISGGKGVADKMDKITELADMLNAQTGASRGLVDMNKASYDKQIGLTGKTVSPKIYIAIGISGAIHHTCAIEGSSTVIAINPDKDARIFEYADYGILDSF